MRNIMLDIETLGTQPGCVVLSIGAVEFDNSGILATFHAHIDVASSHKAGLTVDPSTMMWWLGQSKEAQDAILQPDTVSLQDALAALTDTFEWGNTRLWANGASFDFPILEAAHSAVGVPVPWQFWNLMDYRTLKNLVDKKVYAQLHVKPDIAHDALADAKSQALTAINIMKFIEGDTDAECKAA